jgi:site-specific DNA-methyltransferase (adenine-specific)
VKLECNQIRQGDCIALLEGLDEPVADLIFADPPFNIGYKYDMYEDRKAYGEYYAWTQRWMVACAHKALKPGGSFWVAIGDEYAAEVRIIGNTLGLHLRNWVIWHYTFGQSTKKKFARSHTHLLYFVKDPKNFCFNDMAVRQPSARQTTYADARANPVGKVPDDVWQFSRVCGTFLERVSWHPCQMPERVLERIIVCTSSKGDVVLDPFSGSGTTCATAARLHRQYLGIELSAQYVKHSRERIAQTLSGELPRTEISENPEAKRAAITATRLAAKPRRTTGRKGVVSRLAKMAEAEKAAQAAQVAMAPKRRGRTPGKGNAGPLLPGITL